MTILRDLLIFGSKVIVVFLFGAAVATFAWLALGFIGHAHGAETAVPTYPARLSEQKRGYNYESSAPIDGDKVIVIYKDGKPQEIITTCDGINERLLAKVRMIAEQIAQRPENGYIYKGALETIHSLWCVK